jgi:CHASE3 domain sensor protein
MAAVDMFIKDEDQATTLESKIGQQLEQIKRAARDRQQQNPKYVRRSQTAASSFPWLGL